MFKPDVVLFQSEEPTVVLTLSVRAAEVLQAILENVAGSTTGPRSIVDDLIKRLDDSGIYRPTNISVQLRRAGIYIEEQK